MRLLLGFGVAVAAGLAPYLGTLDVPGFRALLTLLPLSVRDTAIPLSAAVMGGLAVAVQWYGAEHLSRASLRRAFARAGVGLLAALVTFAVIQSFVVVPVPVGAERRMVSFLVGFSRPDRPPCAAADAVGDAECIMRLSLNDARIASFWGDREVRVARLTLVGSYLATTGLFGTLVGLVLLRDERAGAARPAGRGRRPRVARSSES